MLASVRAELGSSTRDLTALVNQVTSILPQFSDDAVCEALVQVDEDVERAVEFLLSRPIVVKPVQTKAKKTKEAPPQVAPQATPSNATGASSSGGRAPARDAGGAAAAPKGKQRKEKEKPAPRNIEHLVQQVLGILPQCGEEAAREALEAREDVQHTVEVLLVGMMNSGKSVKVRAADSTEDGLFDIEEREARPKTSGEKEVNKLTKKMREIERIEEKLRSGEKVDPLQMPKLDKKAELTAQLDKAEKDGKAEVEKAEADERQQLQIEREAALQAVRSAVADLKAKNPPMAPAPTEPPAYSPEAPYTPPTSPPTASPAPPPQNAAKAKAGAALLNMLHGNKGKGGYQQSANAGGQKGKGAPQADATNEEEEDEDDEGWTKVEGGSPQHSSKPAPRWSDEEVQGARDSFNMNEYSTPINANMTWEQREHADRIAKEIEGNHGYETKGKGKGGKDAGGAKGYRSERRDDYGKGKEKGKDDRKGDRRGKDDRGGKGDDRGGKRDDRGGKGDRRGKDDRPRQDDRKGKGAPAERDDAPTTSSRWDKDDAPTTSSRVFEGLPSPQRPPPAAADDDGSPNRLRSSPKARPAAPPPQRMEASRLNW